MPNLITPEPARIDSRRVVLAGTALWALAFVTMLPLHGWLVRHQHRDWLATCAVGVLLGLAGLALMSRHRSVGRQL